MEDIKDNKLVIDVASLQERGVQREQRDAMETSFMRNIYFQASKLIQAIVEYDSNHASDRSAFRSEHFASKMERHNVIAFTGRRGTGKTSTMVSFADFLQNTEFLKKHQINNARFYALDNPIDASMFTKSDYLLRSILSEMYLDMKKKQGQGGDYLEDAQFRKLRAQFIDILKDYNAVTQESKEHNNAENELEAQTDRLFIKNCMEKLVRDYLSYMLRTDYRDDPAHSYLVICVDDIDMAKQNQSDIVNEIYLFLMISNVIVLVTADFDYLKYALQKDFYQSIEFGKEGTKALTDSGALQTLHEQLLDASAVQALNYLQKIVPSDMRITMPSWKKVDYREIYPTVIDTTNLKKLKRLEDRENVPPQQMTPKAFIFYLIAQRTDFFPYIKERNTYYNFLEPGSLRDLYDKFHLLYNMESLSVEDTEQRAAKLNNNRKVLLDYLYFKVIPELGLLPWEDAFVKELLSLTLESRGKRIWKLYFDCLRNPDNREMIINGFGEDFYKKERSLEQERYFCMGEVFRVLFTAPRIGVFRWSFVKLLLVSYAFTMPQYIESLEPILARNDSDLSDAKIDSLRRLRGVFGSSLLGQWIERGSGKGFSLTIPLDEIGQAGKAGWDDVCLLSLLSSNLISNPAKGITIDFDAKTVVIDRLDITALPFNLMQLQVIDCLIFMKFGEEHNCFVYGEDDYQRNIHLDSVIKDYPDDYREFCLTKYEQCYHSFCGLLKELRRTPVPLSFMLKHIDMTYSILKNAVVATFYDSSDNPSATKMLESLVVGLAFRNFTGRVTSFYEAQMQTYYGDNLPDTVKNDIALLNRIEEAIDKTPYFKSEEKWEWKDYSKPPTPPASQDSEEVTQDPEEEAEVPEDGTPTSDEGTAE